MAIGNKVTSLPKQTQTSFGYYLIPTDSNPVYVIVPKISNGMFFIFHNGHCQDWFGSTNDPVAAQSAMMLPRALLAKGYTVALMVMPNLPHGDRMQEYPEHKLRPFLAPVMEVINWAEEMGYESIYMSGLSGGGWTTTMVAALDIRIKASYPVAGTMPLFLKVRNRNGVFIEQRVDKEQKWKEFYDLFPYELLYRFAIEGNRYQVQILNECEHLFPGASVRSSGYAQTIGKGYSLVVVNYGIHEVTPEAVNVILKSLEGINASR